MKETNLFEWIPYIEGDNHVTCFPVITGWLNEFECNRVNTGFGHVLNCDCYDAHIWKRHGNKRRRIL